MKKVMNRPIRILFASFEATPFMQAGGLGDVAGSLPAAIKGTNYDIRVILPKLSMIPEEFRSKMEQIACFDVQLGWRRQYCGLFRLRHKGLTYYFLDNEYYFKRNRLYGEYDDGERVAYFSKAILESILHMPDFLPDVLHCNDWHTALVPVFLREHYRQIPGFDRMKTVFTIHNLKFQGIYPADMLGNVLGLQDTPAAPQLMCGDAVNYLQGAAHYSDRLTTVSPTYAREILTEYYGEKLDWLFRERQNVLSGILNGIDDMLYDPAKISAPYQSFGVDTPEIKRRNKELLQQNLGLEVDAGIPMYAIISRLTEQKGLDLVTRVMPELMQRRCQLVVLGVGAREYEDTFRWYAECYPQKVAAVCTFDAAFSRVLYACADALLMPSRFEPCGLAQMIAMRYGTLPIVRETGGLKDSVIPYNYVTGEGNGFSFVNYNAHEMLGIIDYSLNVWYEHPEAWSRLQKAAMTASFNWKVSAREYRSLYRELIGG